jgi:hypothetical protein
MPTPSSKYGDKLARGARLVVVEDLSYDHEAAEPSIYEHLVELAEQIALTYIGLDQSSQITASASVAEAIASEVVEAVVGAR